MGFFAEFSAWLDRLLATYIADNVTAVAAAIEPALVTLGVLYCIVWGFLQATGKTDDPFLTGVKRIFTLAVILGAALRLWLYNDVIIDTFFAAPSQLAARIVGAFDSIAIADSIISTGLRAARALFSRGGLLHGDISFYFVGAIVLSLVTVTGVYAIFLLALSRVALSVLLALGPIFISLLLFDTTKRFFEAWVAQLANYALVAILTVLASALMLQIVGTAAEQAANEGGTIEIVDGVRVCMAAGLTLLVMRQVTPIAAGLASGLALSTFGVVSGAISWGLRGAARSGGQFIRGLSDRETTRWDPLSRKSGFHVRQALQSSARRIGSWRENSIQSR